MHSTRATLLARASRTIRASKIYQPTLTAAAVSNADTLESLQLLLRGGYVRQSASGTYSFLTPGMRMLDKIKGIINEEMASIDASVIEMPHLLPTTLWHRTGRVEAMGSELFRLKDRKGTEMLIAPTHEEEVTRLVCTDIDSPKKLPVRVYQIGRKFRDEPRPRAGLLRTKEFLMKDLYSFDADLESARASYNAVSGAYERIFNRIFSWEGEKPIWRAAEADTGAMGGNLSHEYHVEDAVGEDLVMTCSSCSYAANTERAVPRVGARTSDVSVSAFAHKDGAALAIYPKSRELNQAALPWPAVPGEGKVAVVVVDKECDLDQEQVRRVAAEHGHDAENAQVMYRDIRMTKPGDGCPACDDGTLNAHRAIEVGHTFLLGSRYTQALGYDITVNNKKAPIQMGCYGIGVTRILGALAQRASALFHERASGKNRAGFIWPASVAPYGAVVIPAPPFTEEKMRYAERLCEALHNGVQIDGAHVQLAHGDVVLDDRDGTLGSRMFDADLLGYPTVCIIGRHWERTGQVEVRRAGQPTVYLQLDY
ncbi:proline--tRNA ligase [Malassezia cuniculi]|uniref:proline--tRNA ligase n=1 Tax=Malassezia cuniculi TaxID=948313 RepID=A0AAF0ERY4_9BASI|nr:proline--tRNA ligase [Malassezia cuniculi]